MAKLQQNKANLIHMRKPNQNVCLRPTSVARQSRADGLFGSPLANRRCQQRRGPASQGDCPPVLVVPLPVHHYPSIMLEAQTAATKSTSAGASRGAPACASALCGAPSSTSWCATVLAVHSCTETRLSWPGK